MAPDDQSPTTRRGFLQASAAAAVGAALASPAASRRAIAAANANGRTLKVGLIGCGGRGTGAAAQALAADENVELAAMGDVFADQIESSLRALDGELSNKVNVTPQRRFVGFDAYRAVIDSDVDVVLLTTPPAFRPQHLAAAVEAGKHSFVEITAAIDAPGVRSVLESSQTAEKKGLAIVSGFCWRYDAALRAVRQQIEQGAIGEVRSIYSTYYRGSLDHKHQGPREPQWTDVEWQIKDWHPYLWLSGDVTLLLSGAHSVDKISWFLGDEMPIRVVGLGSRLIPVAGANTFDNGFAAYEYASGIRTFLGCRSQDGCHTENADYIIGTKGTCTIGRGRSPVIEGETDWAYRGPGNNKFQTEHDELFASIRSGQPINDGPRMAKTTLMALMGRMAAYTGREITWEQALNSQQRLVPEEVNRDTRIEQLPLAVPGITRFA
jgi:predicted dehydrogenase